MNTILIIVGIMCGFGLGVGVSDRIWRPKRHKFFTNSNDSNAIKTHRKLK